MPHTAHGDDIRHTSVDQDLNLFDKVVGSVGILGVGINEDQPFAILFLNIRDPNLVKEYVSWCRMI